MTSIRRILPWLILALYWPALFTATHIPRLPQLHIAKHDLTLHFGAYMILTILYWVARYRGCRPSWREWTVYTVLALMAVYGAVDEISQTLVGRDCDWRDWLADVGGCVTGLALVYLLRSWRKWLVAYWTALFVVTHWPFKEAPWQHLPAAWARLGVVLIGAAYIVLTLLWWRSWQRRGWGSAGKGLALATLIVLPAYALLAESISAAMGSGFDWVDLLGAWAGILIGLVTVALLGRTRRWGPPVEQELARSVGQEA